MLADDPTPRCAHIVHDLGGPKFIAAGSVVLVQDTGDMAENMAIARIALETQRELPPPPVYQTKQFS